MFKSLRIVPVRGTSGHEDLFMQRYERLLDWSLQLTNHDPAQAEDLVHDGFIQFSLSQPDLKAIHDLEGYVFIMLRNLNVSRVRRAAQIQNLSLTVADYDSAAIVLR